MVELLAQHQALEHEIFGRSDGVLQRDGKVKAEAIALIARLAQSLDDAKTPSERTVIFHAIQLWTDFLRDHYRIVDVEVSPSVSPSTVTSKLELRDGVLGKDREASASPSTVTSKLELRDGVLGKDREVSVSPSTVTSKLELRDGVLGKDREVSVSPSTVTTKLELRDGVLAKDREVSVSPSTVTSKLELREGVLRDAAREGSVSPSTVTAKLELRDGVVGNEEREAPASPSTVTEKLELLDGVLGKDREAPAAAVSSLARDAYIIRHASNEMALEVARSAVDIGQQVRLEMVDSVEASFSETLGILRLWAREPVRIDRIGSELLFRLTRRGDRTVDSARRLITMLEGAIEGAGQARADGVKLAGREAGSKPEQVTPRP